MEESSKILKFYKSTCNGFQLRYCNSTYGNTPIISNVDENNIQTIVTQNETSNKPL
jgi:hypothetical protein